MRACVCVESAWGRVFKRFGIDTFRLPRCCTTTDDYKVLQLLQSGRRGGRATLTSCGLRFDRAESFRMPTDLVKMFISFIPFTEKEAPAPGGPLLLCLLNTHTHTQIKKNPAG